MHSKAHSETRILGKGWTPAGAVLTIMLVLLFLIFLMLFMTLTAPPAQGQSCTVLQSCSQITSQV